MVLSKPGGRKERKRLEALLRGKNPQKESLFAKIMRFIMECIVGILIPYIAFLLIVLLTGEFFLSLARCLLQACGKF